MAAAAPGKCSDSRRGQSKKARAAKAWADSICVLGNYSLSLSLSPSFFLPFFLSFFLSFFHYFLSSFLSFSLSLSLFR